MDSVYSLSPTQQKNLETVYRVADACEYDAVHSLHVTFLALRLLEELQPLINFGEQEKYWLHCAGVLHDIGWMEGWKDHHKKSLDTILNASQLPFDNKERLIIGSIARYHRGSLPKMKHDHYAVLSPQEQNTVDILAGCLRIADGLDHSRLHSIRDIASHLHDNKITIVCAFDKDPSMEVIAANRKKNLLELALDKKVVLKFKSAL